MRKFLAAVARDVPIATAYVFGSVARGTAGPDSDVDVAVVSSAFRGRRRIDVTTFLLARTVGSGIDLQPVGLTPEELGDPNDGLAAAIVREGLALL